MEYIFLGLKILMAIMMIFAGFYHFYKPNFYNPIIPDFLPKKLVTYISGFVELVLGIGLFTKGYESISAWGIFILMLVFLPIHIWDATREKPAMKTKKIAYIRILIQFLLIAWAWYLYQNELT
ncbi:hypothetical protein BTO06_13025 [Tenacibaculum sp. SZ-18]|uniref:DoxX family protein n=1 Tax=Tenacibaculum sp. SZ-18 TaxID=754423 RepID=UPI000C2D0C4C|nr:hypothetical protein [Tenacibaculum sp. SZ-18]AUC16021.1 hypothetical protein BTO06_13025 [Tenacibaculum sp. SZ-18]